LDKAKLGPSDIKPVLTDDAGKAGEIFAAGQADAAVTWEPWLSRVVESGKGHVLVNSRGAKDILIGILAANREKLNGQNVEKLERFFRGWYRGLEYYMTHREESIPIMAKGFQLPPEEFASILGGLRFIGKDEAKRLVGADGSRGDFSDISKYEQALWVKAGAIKQPVDPSVVYTSKVLVGVK
jgi:NitT/TauT family transport system substrate-binding protein